MLRVQAQDFMRPAAGLRWGRDVQDFRGFSCMLDTSAFALIVSGQIGIWEDPISRNIQAESSVKLT